MPQPFTPESKSLKLVITSPSHLSTLKENNAVLRSHNLSLAKQNRQLRSENTRLAKGGRGDSEPDLADITNLQNRLKAASEENTALENKNKALQQGNQVLNECGVEWARREAMLSMQTQTLTTKNERLLMERRTIVEQYQRMKAELDMTKQMMAGVDTEAKFEFDEGSVQCATTLNGTGF